MTFSTINPYNGQLIKEFADATDSEIEYSIYKSDKAFHSWKLLSIAERVTFLEKAACILRKNKRYFAEIITLEMGKIISEAEAEIELSAEIFDYYVKNSESFLVDKMIPSLNSFERKAMLTYEPLGIILAIEPWNFPFYQVARVLAPQLSAGNTLILKHASNVPQCAEAFEKLMIDAGLPEGVFINLYLPHEKVEMVIQDPRVHGVALTGSESAGETVAKIAAKYLKKTTLELGGADALIVLEDADLNKTVEWAIFGRHWNAGQVCVSSKRIIVHENIYEKFLEKYIEGVSKIKAGDPMKNDTQLAPLSSKKAADNLKKQIEKAVSFGAHAQEAGQKVPQNSAFVQPTILTNVARDNPAWYEEFFGPVSMIIKSNSDDEAIHIANDSNFGLGGSIFTADTEYGYKLAKKIISGMVYINHPTMVKADLPFGGVKRSGYGRELLDLGLKEFVNTKLIAIVDIDSSF